MAEGDEEEKRSEQVEGENGRIHRIASKYKLTD